MRILRVIFTTLFFFLAVSALVFFTLREGLLLYASSQLSSDYSKLRSLAGNTGEYQDRCQNRSGELAGGGVSQVQLRFIDDKEYVIEVLCNRFELTPITADENILPWSVKKLAGNTGFVWQKNSKTMRGGVRLEIWGRERAFGPGLNSISADAVDTAAFDVGPLSSCEGYGYACCNQDTEEGTGELYSAVLDCPQNCYATCEKLPIILSLNTDPYLTPETRTVSIASDQSVTFQWVVELPTDTGVIEIDYGDGSSEEVAASTEQTQHTYTCSRSRCRYEVQIQATDAAGRRSAQTPITQLVVEVTTR